MLEFKALGDGREICTAAFDVTQAPSVDPVTFEIVKNRTQTIAAEMGLSVLRTAHSILFAETKDFSCALFDAHGHMVAMADYLPNHQGQMQSTISGLASEVGLENLREGDIYMMNDATFGGGHCQDVTLFAPIFHDGEMIAIAGCIVHHIDMGGMAPSSYCPEATEIYQEGMRFPPTTKLYDRGELRRDILNIFRTNVRLPESQVGDLMAQVAGVRTGMRRLQETAERYGTATVKDVLQLMQVHSAQSTRQFIGSLPDGVYEAEDCLDGDGITDRSYRIHCRLTVRGQEIEVDFSGTDSQALGFVNSYWGNTASGVYVALMMHIPDDVPKNFGVFSPVTIVTRRGTLLNPAVGAPLGACTTEAGHLITDVVHRCLGQANPERYTASWGANHGLHMFWGVDPRTSRRYVGFATEAGAVGGGARPTSDGWPTASMRSSNVTIANVELMEAEHPVLYKRRRLPADTEPGGGGPGRFRGGSSCEYEFEPYRAPLRFSTIFGRHRTPPTGVKGGAPGSLAQVVIKDARTGEVKRVLPNKVLNVPLELGESVWVVPASGGGYGPALERDPQAVLADWQLGFTTVEGARQHYGVVIDPRTRQVDVQATAEDRRERFVSGSRH